VIAKTDEIECPNCDRRIPADATRCPGCGADLSLSSLEELEEVARKISNGERPVSPGPVAETKVVKQEEKAVGPKPESPKVDEKRPEEGTEKEKKGFGRLFGTKKKK
jgi:hypothetical protein